MLVVVEAGTVPGLQASPSALTGSELRKRVPFTAAARILRHVLMQSPFRVEGVTPLDVVHLIADALPLAINSAHPIAAMTWPTPKAAVRESVNLAARAMEL
ncbi:hypothetical protein D9V37_10780 [Nocardioides mangrovicus]|uniref:Uncharacterized protein n=1 Tax=Nocardioides mangrovicus TaxID=2478913 RepID=A0A3L8P2H5_9ACTN|nr:hypothetical protein D9V37_10780 [Nocardioides mangrovicus]